MELYAYYSVIFFALIIILLYLYIITAKVVEHFAEKKKAKYRNDVAPICDNIINELINGNNAAIEKFNYKNILKNNYKKNIIEEKIIYYLETFKGDFTHILTKFCEDCGIIDNEIIGLSKKNVYTKALSCKRLGEMRSKKSIPFLLKELNSPSQDVTYNVLLALAKIGDAEAFTKAFENINSSILLSERILIEVIDSFEGDKNYVYSKMIDCSNEFTSCLFIKSAGNYKDYSLGKKISQFLNSESNEKRISAIKALGNMGDNRYIYEISELLEDESWEVRAIAAKALGRFEDTTVIPLLIEALSDKQWFVRYNAADSLLTLDKNYSYIPLVFQSEDRFAKDIVIAAMEHTNKLSILFDNTDSNNINKNNVAALVKNYIENGGVHKNE